MVIVYRSNTGFTKQYAELLGKAEGMKVYEASSAPLDFGAHVLYMGPVAAGHIEGLQRARKQYNVKAVCGIGMAPPTEDALAMLKKNNYVYRNVPLFYLQGGWAPRQVDWVKRHMVNLVTRPVRKSLLAKGSRRTEEEQAYLELLTSGGSRVSVENLDAVRQWLKEQSAPAEET